MVGKVLHVPPTGVLLTKRGELTYKLSHIYIYTVYNIYIYIYIIFIYIYIYYMFFFLGGVDTVSFGQLFLLILVF